MIKKCIAVLCVLSLVFTQVAFLNVSAAIDKLAPVFKSSVPKSNQIDAKRNAKISISFSENIYKGSSYTSIKVTNLTNNKKISIKKSISRNLLVISHAYFFGYDTLYSVTIPAKAVKDKAGNLLKKAVTVKFRTVMKSVSAQTSECLGNLRVLNGAIQTALANGDTVSGIDDLVPKYISLLPVCPSGGTYTFVAATETDIAHFTCSVTEHKCQMYWPVPGYYSVSSPFGLRYHPLTGVEKMHTGIDIPAPSGTSVIAAGSGKVISAKWSDAYGNYIVIDHGGGISTFYGHLKSILVSDGELVSKGKIIGEVGTTGYSTGPHLHFGVIKDGQDVDPLSYV